MVIYIFLNLKVFFYFLFIILCFQIPSTTPDAERPKEGERVLCLHPFEEQKRVYVVPARVEALHTVVWNGYVSVIFSPSLLHSSKSRSEFVNPLPLN
jgi:hypothetical protein